MKSCCLTLAAVCLLMASPLVATAQPALPPSAASASASQPAMPIRRQLTLTEMREGAASPGELHPGGRVTTQFSIPLSKTPPAPLKPELHPARGGAAASSVGAGDAAARCDAEPDAQARVRCRDAIGRESRRR